MNWSVNASLMAYCSAFSPIPNLTDMHTYVINTIPLTPRATVCEDNTEEYLNDFKKRSGCRA